MLRIILPDGSQVAVTYDAEGLPQVDHRDSPSALWCPLPASKIVSGDTWCRLIANGAASPLTRQAAIERMEG